MSEGRREQQESSRSVRVLVAGEQTQARFALLEMAARAGQAPPLHAHTLEDEVIYVVRGAVVVHLDGSRRRFVEGECVLLPRGSEHSYSVESGDATLLLFVMPAGLESYYRELDRPAKPERHIEQMITASARYGIEIVGPAPPAARRTAAIQSDGREEADMTH